MIMFEKYSRLKPSFKGHSFWARGYYVNMVGLASRFIKVVHFSAIYLKIVFHLPVFAAFLHSAAGVLNVLALMHHKSWQAL